MRKQKQRQSKEGGRFYAVVILVWAFHLQYQGMLLDGSIFLVVFFLVEMILGGFMTEEQLLALPIAIGTTHLCALNIFFLSKMPFSFFIKWK